jgi:hypothetical protein
MGAHCRTVAGALHQPERSAWQAQEFGALVPVLTGMLGAAFGALVGQRVATGDDLWYRRHPARPQAAAADHEIAEAIQQPITHVVPGDGSHGGSPVVDALLWH